MIGIVGGIGSGKSFVARLMRDAQRVVVVDADAAGHRVLEEEPIKKQIRKRFGDHVFDPQGHVDRRALGRAVFGSASTSTRSKTDLEAIVHPRIRRLLSQEIAELKSRSEVEAVVLDAAVLLETGWREFCDVIVFVDVPRRQRQQRVAKSRGWTAEELQSREAGQFTLEAKKAAADFIIDNSGTAEQTAAQLEQLFPSLIRGEGFSGSSSD